MQLYESVRIYFKPLMFLVHFSNRQYTLEKQSELLLIKFQFNLLYNIFTSAYYALTHINPNTFTALTHTSGR